MHLKANVKLLRGGVDGRRWPKIEMGDHQFQRYELQEWYEGRWVAGSGMGRDPYMR